MNKTWSLSTLKERGWSPRLIAELLGARDRLVPNPNYRSGPKMHLYDQERVLATENDPAFVRYQQSRAKRLAAGTATASRKRTELLREIEDLPITVTRRSIDR